MTHTWKRTVPLAVAVLLALGNFGLAQTTRPSGNGRESGAQAQRQQTLTGRVESLHRVNIKGTDQQALLAVLRTERGRVVVDLGPAAKRKDVERGDRLTVQGRFRWIGERPVLLTERMQADGRSQTVDRGRPRMPAADEQAVRQDDERPAARSQQGHPLRRTMREVTGTVTATKEVKLRDSQRKNLVALVQTDKGRKLIVDLGPARDVKHLELRKGDRITARGYDIMLKDRPVLIAFRVQADGETLAIDRQGQVRRSRGQPTQTIGSPRRSD